MSAGKRRGVVLALLATALLLASCREEEDHTLAPPPSPAAPDLSAASDTGVSSTDDITNDTTPTFTGMVEANATVRLHAGGTPVGTAAADSSGNYAVTASVLVDGTYSFTVTATDAAGNESAPSPALSVTIDTTDPFGVLMVYPTATGGREWFFNAADPFADGQFGSLVVTPTPQGGDVWRVSRETSTANEGVRLNVDTPSGVALWLNIEMTGYVKLLSSSFPEEFAWRTTSTSPHSGTCGTAYYGLLKYDGHLATVLKEVWHNKGYAPSPVKTQNPTPPLNNRWIGFKTVRTNVSNNTQVKVELWLDENADNTWRKIHESIDSGWAATVPFPQPCPNPLTGQPKTLDVIMTWPYPLVTFRADNATFDFKWLSVREILTSP